MRDANTIVRDRQLLIRRQMDDRGISLKAVSLDSKIPYATVVSYFPGERDRQPAVIPGAAIYTLLTTKALPVDLLSLLLPDGFQIVRADEGLDHDEIERQCRDFLATKGEAHRPDSPGGREISDCERVALDGKVVAMRGRA
ncbi:hypothetical protein [Sphingomonas sp.]|uniref:hypothetical protein n=1 Tax=Sphingomonas sp. TaxID=28214 RepID=UPI0035C7B640